MTQAPLNALRVFEAVARHGSFSRAADELCVTQSAVSHQVRHLEAWLGGPVFARVGNRAELLPHGAVLGRLLGAAFADIELACRQARRAAGPPVLTVAVIPSVAICWLIPRLAGFRARSPGTEVRIVYAMPGREADLRDADAAVVFSRGLPEVPGMMATRFLDGASVPVCSPGFAAARPLASPGQIAAAGLLHDTDHGGWRDWMAAAGAAVAAVPSGPVFEDFNLLRVAALAGQGIALCPSAIITDDLAAGRLVQLSALAVREDHAYVLLRRIGGDAAAVFCDWLLAARALDSGPGQPPG